MRMVLATLLAACATGGSDHEEASDFEVDPAQAKADGLPSTFDINNVVDDTLLVNSHAMAIGDVQAFLETTPYHNRSWLASYELDGQSAAEVVVEIAETRGVNPIILLARMQVESSLVSKTVVPSQHAIDRALGCGCPDGGTCDSSYSGLREQLDCGAYVLRKHFEESQEGSGAWRVGHTTHTLDPKPVTPENSATAAFYAYTPWVLVGTGGTWLAWNVTRKYVHYAQSSQLISE